jgi:hypothetical protein
MSFFTHTTKHGDIFIVVDDNRWIPTDELNMDYQQYLAWVAEGNTAEEWIPTQMNEEQ